MRNKLPCVLTRHTVICALFISQHTSVTRDTVVDSPCKTPCKRECKLPVALFPPLRAREYTLLTQSGQAQLNVRSPQPPVSLPLSLSFSIFLFSPCLSHTHAHTHTYRSSGRAGALSALILGYLHCKSARTCALRCQHCRLSPQARRLHLGTRSPPLRSPCRSCWRAPAHESTWHPT